jgi:hypothetical protein
MLWSYDLPLIDSYFMLDCSDANGAPEPRLTALPGPPPGGVGGGADIAVDAGPPPQTLFRPV